jgi:transposase
MQDPTASTAKASPLEESPMGNTRRLEEVSQERHQERVERYRKIHELHAKKVDQGSIARQVGTSRQTVTRYIHMDQPEDAKKPAPHPYTSARSIQALPHQALERWVPKRL